MANPTGINKMVVLNEEQIIQIEALAGYLSKEQIADYFGITKMTFYSILERQPETLVRYKKGKAMVIKDIAKSLITQAREGNIAAICFYLKTQAGWKETVANENTNINKNFNFDDVAYPKDSYIA
jgi:hypothetical protein